MGGTGSVFGKQGPADRARKDREKLDEQRADQEGTQQYEQEVSLLLGQLLGQFNERDQEAIEQHLNTLKKALEAEIEGTVDVRFGGSVAKRTYVDGLSDVDALVLLNGSELADKSPAEVLEHFAQSIRDKLPGTPVDVGRLAVTVHFSDGQEIQLLPALQTPSGYRIKDAEGDGWANIKPQEFAQQLTDANSQCGMKLVPTVKLAKAINDTLPEARKLSGYHIEALAVAAFAGYDGECTTKAMLPKLFETAAELVRRPISDCTGQSVAVDEALGLADSRPRQAVSAELSRIARKMRNADALKSPALWGALFGE